MDDLRKELADKGITPDILFKTLDFLWQAVQAYDLNFKEVDDRIKSLEAKSEVATKPKYTDLEKLTSQSMQKYLGISDRTFDRLLVSGKISRLARNFYAINKAHEQEMISKYGKRMSEYLDSLKRI